MNEELKEALVDAASKILTCAMDNNIDLTSHPILKDSARFLKQMYDYHGDGDDEDMEQRNGRDDRGDRGDIKPYKPKRRP